MTAFDWTLAALLYCGAGNSIFCARFTDVKRARPVTPNHVMLTVYTIVVMTWPQVILFRLFNPRAKEAHKA